MNMRTSVTIDLAGNLEAKAKRYSRAMHRMSRSSIRDMNLMHRSARRLGRGIDRMGSRYAGMLAGGGLAIAGKQVVDLQRRFTRLGNQSNRTVEVMNALKNEIFNISQLPEIRIDPSQLTSGVEKIINKVGQFGLAEDNLRNMALLIQATGAEGNDAGALIADFYEKFKIRSPKEFLSVLDMLTNQGKAGSFTLQDIATQGERVTSAYARLGRVGPGALREMGAMLQMIRKGTGSPEQAATSLQAYVRTLNNVSKRKLIAKAGITLMDPKDPKRMRSLVDITRDLMRVSGGNAAKLSTIFDGEAMMALSSSMIEFSQTGRLASFDGFMKAASDGSSLLRDSTRAAHDAAGAMQNLYTAWSRFADAKLTGPIEKMANTLNALGSNNVMEALGDVALAGGAAYAGRKIYKGSRRGARALAREGSRAALKKTATGALTRTAARGLGALGPVGAVAATGFTAYELGSAIEKALIGGRLGSWLYDITHSKVDVNLTLNQKGQAHVSGVAASGIVGDTSIDNGLMQAGAY